MGIFRKVIGGNQEQYQQSNRNTNNYISKEMLKAHSGRVLNTVGMFLRESDRDRIEKLSDELELLYEKSLMYYNQFHLEDPVYAGIVGFNAYALTIYYVEYRFVPSEAEKYAMSGRTYLKENLDRSSGTMGNAELNTVKTAYDTVSEYAAYLAFYDERYYEVLPLLNDTVATITALALLGSSMALIADKESNIELARRAMVIFEKMDNALNTPAVRRSQEDIYRNAYTFYAMMLAKNPDHYPGYGFERNVPKAIYCLRKAISLIKDEQYIEWLQEDIDDYSRLL